jgi:ATP-dependent Clp protease protease subunit
MSPSNPFESSSFRDQLSGRLLEARTVVVNEALTEHGAGRITEQLTVLDAESAEPIRVLMSNAPGGAVEAALSVYDLLRALTAPVRMLGGGRISGAGVVAFLGAPAAHRCALPHVRFGFDEPSAPTASGTGADLAAQAEAARDRRARVVKLIAGATGQAAAQVETDLAERRTFDADEAQAYGLIDRVVQSRREAL